MTDETEAIPRSSSIAELLESMRVPQEILVQPACMSRERIAERSQGWRPLVGQLAEGAAHEAELATLYEINRALYPHSICARLSAR